MSSPIYTEKECNVHSVSRCNPIKSMSEALLYSFSSHFILIGSADTYALPHFVMQR
jgi:hypothetical protein